MRKIRLLLFVLFLCFFLVTGMMSSIAQELPNILIIYADDLGYGDLSCYNPKSAYQTPHLDRMAREGIRFTDSHSPSTISSPSRYGLYSGQQIFRSTGGGGGAFEGPGGPSYLKPGTLTIADMLKAKGYHTGMFGKWHVGLTWVDKDNKRLGNGFENSLLIDYEKSTPLIDGPNARGFDESFITPNCPNTDPLYIYIENGRVPVPASQRHLSANLPNPGGKWLWDNDEGWMAPGYTFIGTDLMFFDKTRKFITEHRKQKPDQPFFAVLSTQIAHAPVLPSDAFNGATQAGPRGDFVVELDAIVGQVFDLIRELGIDGNTLVIFNADNGAETVHVDWMRQDHNHDPSGGWRGMKRDGWEGGHRVPFIARWPGVIPAGQVSRQMINTTDIFATLASVVGYTLRDEDARDSYDMLPAMLGIQDERKQIRPYLLTQSFRGEFQIRQGEWKYLDHKGSGGNNYNDPEMAKYKLPENEPEAPGQLYNLSTDPGERNNLYFSEEAKRTEMQNLLKELKTSGRSAPLGRKPIGIGKIREISQKDPVTGNRFFTLSTVVRVNQIEVARDRTDGADESGIHSAAEARLFRETVEKGWPGARITWAFSWLALKDQRPNYQEIKKLVVQYHHTYGDEITFIPGGYFANMYNTREQVNRDLHEGLQMVSEMVGNGYRPLSVVAGFLSAENLRYLAEVENIHVCQGNIWSQYAIDNGDGEGSLSYPYYPSKEHFCKPAQGDPDFIDCVNLDGWTMDFLTARFPGGRTINGEWCGSRQGVGPIETVIRLGQERGTREMLAVTSAHFDQGFALNGFAWVTCIWELGLVEGRKIWGYHGRNGLEGMVIWLSEMRKRWPDAQCITQGEFGMKWREQFKTNEEVDYRFVQKGTGICGSDPNEEIRWFMNKDFRLALLRDWKNNGPEKLIDFTRYDVPAQEPEDPKPGSHSRNWSLMNRLNQKGIRHQDQPMDINDLNPDEKELIRKRYPQLLREEIAIEELSSGFADPAKQYRPGAFWCWLNGNMTETSISRDLKEMSEKGMGRAEIWDVAAVRNKDNYIPAGPAFLSDSSVALIRHAISEGKKHGMKVGMVGSSGWNAGGPWVQPDWASKQLFYSQVTVKGPVKGPIDLPFPEVPKACPIGADGKPLYFREVAVLAMPAGEKRELMSVAQILNLTGQSVNGQVQADLPAGDWILLRFICSNNGQKLIVPSPKSSGLFIDFLDPQSTVKHLKHFMDRLGIIPGDTSTTGLAYIEFDSMELDEGIPWTDSMPSVFRQQRGYDLTYYLPVLAGWTITGVSDRFLYDWTKTISDQLIFSHYITGREFLKDYDVQLVAEAGGPGPPTWSTCPVDALKALGNVSVPRGEFWIQHRNIFLVKEVASASHIYGRKLVDAESFTTWRRWKDSPADLKKVVDRAFCEGLNLVTFHTFASTNPEDGLPGRTYHAGSDINTSNTWWNKSKPFMDYLARCSYLLQQGRFMADACYFYGDQAPNFYPAYHWVPEKPIPADLDPGYDFDVVNSDVILNRMTVKEGRIMLPDGMSYAVLVLPEQDHMPLEVLEKLESMVLQGAKIIGKKPATVPYLNQYQQDNQSLAAIADRMWKGSEIAGQKIHYYGKGQVVYGMGAREFLNWNETDPDFSHTPQNALDYIHRRTGDSDIYFIRNQSGKPWSGRCYFRGVNGRVPEIWDPSTGAQIGIKNYEADGNITFFNLSFEAGESLFVVFTNKQRSLPLLGEGLTTPTPLRKLDRNWTITFPEGWGAPAEAAFDSLYSWTDSKDQGIRYFSGTAAYQNTFTLKKSDLKESRILLELGKVYDLAEVFVNGQSAGILWKEPFTVDITPWVKSGKNDLKIEVVNQWVNRLTGDMLSEPKDRFCRTNQPYITKDNQGSDNWAEGGDETFRVQTSGLLGPVRILKR